MEKLQERVGITHSARRGDIDVQSVVLEREPLLDVLLEELQDTIQQVILLLF